MNVRFFFHSHPIFFSFFSFAVLLLLLFLQVLRRAGGGPSMGTRCSSYHDSAVSGEGWCYCCLSVAWPVDYFSYAAKKKYEKLLHLYLYSSFTFFISHKPKLPPTIPFLHCINRKGSSSAASAFEAPTGLSQVIVNMSSGYIPWFMAPLIRNFPHIAASGRHKCDTRQIRVLSFSFPFSLSLSHFFHRHCSPLLTPLH
jgi:hypothetical protein